MVQKKLEMLGWNFVKTEVSIWDTSQDPISYTTVCYKCNPRLKTIDMPWFSETNIVYEVKSIGENTYIEILGTQVKVSVPTNPFLDIVW